MSSGDESKNHMDSLLREADDLLVGAESISGAVESLSQVKDEKRRQKWASYLYYEVASILWDERKKEESVLYLRKALILNPKNTKAWALLHHPPSDPDGVTANLPKQPQPPLSGCEAENRTELLRDEDEES